MLTPHRGKAEDPGQHAAARLTQRRAALLAEARDGAEREGKRQLLARLDGWLASVGMGGCEARGFDPVALVQLAWAEQLEAAPVEAGPSRSNLCQIAPTAPRFPPAHSGRSALISLLFS